MRLPAMRETWVWSLGGEDPMEKEMATHSSILAWKIPWTEEPGGLQSMGSQRVGHDWTTSLSKETKIGLKIYCTWPCHQNKNQFPPQVSLSHQEASISLLSFSIRGQTDWKHSHRKLTNLLTWTTALSNSVKLWAMPCRATQDRQVTVKSSDKTWSTGEGNDKLFQHFWEPSQTV